MPYDVLVVAVGAVNNTFNTPGVEEHAFFLKVILPWRCAELWWPLQLASDCVCAALFGSASACRVFSQPAGQNSCR